MKSCPVCDKELRSNVGMVGHINNQHPDYSDHDCPECGKTFLSKRGLSCHYVQVHGESIAGIGAECAYCGASIRRKKSKIDGYERNFCNQSCFGKWRQENRDSEWFDRYDRVSVNCLQCGEGFDVKKSRENAKFCSQDCMAGYYAENYTQSNHPNWKGGRQNYGKGWSQAKREAVRERDGRQCQHCGRSEAKHIELYGTKLEVHHIEKARTFDDPEKRNSMDNLISLCKSQGCHPKWEKMSPLRPQT